jgi:hypothetical protein
MDDGTLAMRIAFKNLSWTVDVPNPDPATKKATPTIQKKVLKNVSGLFRPGKLTAVMVSHRILLSNALLASCRCVGVLLAVRSNVCVDWSLAHVRTNNKRLTAGGGAGTSPTRRERQNRRTNGSGEGKFLDLWIWI